MGSGAWFVYSFPFLVFIWNNFVQYVNKPSHITHTHTYTYTHTHTPSLGVGVSIHFPKTHAHIHTHSFSRSRRQYSLPRADAPGLFFGGRGIHVLVHECLNFSLDGAHWMVKKRRGTESKLLILIIITTKRKVHGIKGNERRERRWRGEEKTSRTYPHWRLRRDASRPGLGE